MKKIKMKDTILAHYQKVYEIKMDGYTVRVYKPRTMQQLPAHMMLSWIKHRAEEAIRYMALEYKTDWRLGNPDYGMWDAQTVYRYDPYHKAFDIYIAAILVRPFSREAYETYCRMHESIDDVNQRLMLMWDSREYDRIGGYDTSYGDAESTDLYQTVNEEDDIEDHSPGSRHDNDGAGVKRRCVKFKADGKDIVYNAVVADDETMKRGGTPLMHACAKVFCDFRKDYPEVTEIHFYTDDVVSTNGDAGE